MARGDIKYEFRLASTAEEREGVWRLNHETFSRELGQHELAPDGLLVDRYAATTRYLCAFAAGRVVGMIAVNAEPPFSIEKRLPLGVASLADWPARRLEVRLLAIEPAHRNSMVLAGLLGSMIELAAAEGFEAILISGVVNRLAMYRRLGFRELGPPVPDGAAAFVPMAMRIGELPEHVRTGIRRWRARGGSLLP